MVNVGERIKQLRDDQGLTGKELAKQVQLDPSQISKIEKGEAKPSIDALYKICKSLNISLSDFFSTDRKDIDPELRKLLHTTEHLSTKQLKLLNDFLETLKHE